MYIHTVPVVIATVSHNLLWCSVCTLEITWSIFEQGLFFVWYGWEWTSFHISSMVSVEYWKATIIIRPSTESILFNSSVVTDDVTDLTTELFLFERGGTYVVMATKVFTFYYRLIIFQGNKELEQAYSFALVTVYVGSIRSLSTHASCIMWQHGWPWT